MHKTWGEQGQLNVLLVPVILLTLLFLGAAGFGIWAFGQRTDFKDNVDTKIQAAVSANTKAVQANDQKTYAEAAKSPLKTYVGPEQYGSIHVTYPKTWSAYVDTTSSSTPVNGYWYPDVVPSAQDQTASFALRVQVVQSSYSQVVSNYSALQKSGKVTVAPYALPKVPGQVGVIIQGQIESNRQGSMVVLPLRDKTFEIWTESSAFLPDLMNNVLQNTTFSP